MNARSNVVPTRHIRQAGGSKWTCVLPIFPRLVVILFFGLWLLLMAPTKTLADNWIDGLPTEFQSTILWRADHESSTLNEWLTPNSSGESSGGGMFNTGGTDVVGIATEAYAHSGSWSAQTTITNAIRAENGNRAVRLMRWTEKAWEDGGDFFPNAAYYSIWAYFPEVYNPNKYEPWDINDDGGWWNIFQFKGKDSAGDSQPLWVLNVDHDDTADAMSLYLYSKANDGLSVSQVNPIALPAGQWVHLEAYYEASEMYDGQIKIWQDGTLILSADGVRTSLIDDIETVWGIGNYTDHIAGDSIEGTATIYFDDALVSTSQVSGFLTSVPEPSTFLALGLLSLGLASRRRCRLS